MGEFMKQLLFLDNCLNLKDDKLIIENKSTKNFTTTHYLVTKENKKNIKRCEGDYFVIEFSYENLLMKQNFIIKEVERVLKSFLKKYQKTKKILVVGLGNELVLADSLGIKTTNKVISTNQYNDFLTLPKIALFNPSVTNKTGIDSYKLIEMVVNNIDPDCILMIDSLLTKNEDYLNSAIEINDTGIIPGSALNSSKEISFKTFKIPVITIGVPTTLKLNNKLYTSVFLSDVIENASLVIASSLNHIFLL